MLCVCLWVISLDCINWGGKVYPLRVATLPRQQTLACLRMEKVNWALLCIHPLHFLVVLGSFCFCFFFFDSVSPRCLGAVYVHQAGLELTSIGVKCVCHHHPAFFSVLDCDLVWPVLSSSCLLQWLPRPEGLQTSTLSQINPFSFKLFFLLSWYFITIKRKEGHTLQNLAVGLERQLSS